MDEEFAFNYYLDVVGIDKRELRTTLKLLQ